MATHDVDQKLLARLARRNAAEHPVVSSALYQILGLSVLLARRLVRARTMRKTDSLRDHKTLATYHHIIWLSREGLSLLETFVIPEAGGGQLGIQLRIFAAKLRASFYHVFCLFHNTPPVSQFPTTPRASPRHPSVQGSSPLSPRNGNGQRRRTSSANGSPTQNASNDKENLPQSPSQGRSRKAGFRDTIPSMVSDTSYVTNPYAVVSPPPGLTPLTSVPNPSSFLLPAQDYIPITRTVFDVASKLADDLLPGSAPLRLSVALEHCAFLWDCVHDHDGSRRLARKTIRDVYRAQEGMDDEEFEDSAILVGTLGRMMRRKSQDGTPRFGDMTPPHSTMNRTPNIPTRQQPPTAPPVGSPLSNVATDAATSSTIPAHDPSITITRKPVASAATTTQPDPTRSTPT